MSTLSARVDALATRIATEFKAMRARLVPELPSLAAARTYALRLVNGVVTWVRVDPYVPGRKYTFGTHVSFAGGGAGSTGQITLVYGTLRARVTMARLGYRLSSTVTAGQSVFAIYASDPETGRPVGPPLSVTAAGSLATQGMVNLDFPTPLTLEAGGYWIAFQTTHSTAAFYSMAGLILSHTETIGTERDAIASAGGTQPMGLYTTAPGFGIFPDLTGLVFLDQTPNRIPAVQFEVAL